MDNITPLLKHKLEFYQKIKFVDESYKTVYDYQKVNDVWAQIIPLSGSQSNFGGIDPSVNEVNVSHKIKTRYLSCKNIAIDNYFMYDGLKFEVVSWNKDYKNRSYMDIICNVRYE